MRKSFVRRLFGLSLLSLVAGSPLVALARIPNDDLFGQQWYLSRIDSEAAWDTGTGNADLVIAVLDTGVDLDHPDLRTNLWHNSAEIKGNHLDDDDNGLIDDTDGWDFVDDDGVPEPEPSSDPDSGVMSHGTLIAGLIGARGNNSLGYTGLLWEVKVMPLRVLNEDGSGTENATAEAIDYAVANGARVINMSFAGDTGGTRLRSAVRRAYDAGVVIVAALGNDGESVDEFPVYPACLHSEIDDWVLGVTATDEFDGETSFTNYGASCADLSAPGQNISGLGFQDVAGDLAYSGPWNGTSTASPLVAGAAGLLLSTYPSLTPEQVFTILKLGVDPIKSPFAGAGTLGVGRLNIAQSLALAPAFVDLESVPEVEISDPGTDKIVDEATPIADETYDDAARYSFIALGAPAEAAPDVSVYRADGTAYASFPAYAANFKGGVRVAVEDIDGDYIPEVVTGAGPGGGPHVRVFKPYGALVSEFFAYAPTSDKGVNVAVGDVNADGEQDVVTAVGSGVSNDVIIWSGQGIEISRFTVTGFADGAPLAVAIADVDSDWEKEIVVFSETGESRVAIYNIEGDRVVDFIAFPGDAHGVRVDVGDLDGDYRDEIVTVGGVGADAQVRIYNKIGAYWGGFVTPQTESVGLRVAVADIDVNGEPDVVVMPQSGSSQVSVYLFTGDLLKTIGQDLASNRGGYLGAW